MTKKEKHVSLTPEEAAFFTSLLKPKQLRKGHFLFEAGEVATFMCFVLKGCLRSYHIDEKGKLLAVVFGILEPDLPLIVANLDGAEPAKRLARRVGSNRWHSTACQ